MSREKDMKLIRKRLLHQRLNLAMDHCVGSAFPGMELVYINIDGII